MKQIEVINLETIIDVTAETSNVEILVQDYDSELAERFALEAQEAAIDAEESADIATAQASIATAQAGIATTQAGIATTQAGNALTSANNAAASAQEAQDIVDSIITADLTESTSSVLTITGGTDAVLGTGTTIQVKQAGSSQSGFLSSTDWTTFNSKQNTITNPVTGTGAFGQVAFWNGTSSQTGDNGLFWNNTNKRLGIGTTGPVYQLSVFNSAESYISLNNTNTGNSSSTGFQIGLEANGLDVYFINRQNGFINFRTNNVDRVRLFNTGNLLLQNGGTFTDAGFRLDVNGTARVQGVTTITGSTTAASAIARGANLTSTLVAAANNDVLVGLDVNPTFTNGAFTGVSNYAIRVGNHIGISTLNAFSLNYILFNALTSNQGISASFSANGTPTNLAYNFQFSKSSTANNNSLLFIGGGSGGSSNTANKHVISTSADGTATGQPLVLRVAATGQGFGLVNDQLSIFPTGNVVIQNASSSATDAGFRLDVNGTARVQGNLTASLFFGGGNNSTIIYADATIASGVVIQRSNRGATATSPIVIFSHDTLGEQARLLSNGLLALGTNSPNASAILDITSTTRGFLPPRMTTTQKNAIASPATGLVVYDNTLNKLAVYTGLVWETITSL